MQRPIKNPMMTCGVPAGGYNAMPKSSGTYRINQQGPCFASPTPQCQPSPCFMSVAMLKKPYPSTKPRQTRYDPCFN